MIVTEAAEDSGAVFGGEKFGVVREIDHNPEGNYSYKGCREAFEDLGGGLVKEDREGKGGSYEDPGPTALTAYSVHFGYSGRE